MQLNFLIGQLGGIYNNGAAQKYLIYMGLGWVHDYNFTRVASEIIYNKPSLLFIIKNICLNKLSNYIV